MRINSTIYQLVCQIDLNAIVSACPNFTGTVLDRTVFRGINHGNADNSIDHVKVRLIGLKDKGNSITAECLPMARADILHIMVKECGDDRLIN